jgi:RNA polymerase sigma-70 factor (ECF subfamily)
VSAFDPRTDGQLLVATATDPEAFAVFYRRHVRGVLAFFRRRVDRADVAFDLTAETFAAALEASPRYRPRPEPARGWLYGIAWNQLRDAQRHGRAEDTARRALKMAPIALDDEAIARLEATAGAQAVAVRRRAGPDLDAANTAITQDPVSVLERELVHAARRRMAPPIVVDTFTDRRRAQMRQRRTATWVAAAALAMFALVTGLVALLIAGL